MNKVEFRYKNGITIIQCMPNDKMSEICIKFANKAHVDKNSIFFSYNGVGGNEFNEELTFSQMAGNKNENKMCILVYDLNEENNNKTIKSKKVICPKCGKNIKLNIKNYKINLFDCINNHEVNNLSIKEFEKSQLIDLSKITCKNCPCNNNKSTSYQNQFFKCLDCNRDLCPLCKQKHTEHENILEDELIDYICQEHNDYFSKYCNKCKKNICSFCKKAHINHDLVDFSDIVLNKKELQLKLNELQKFIDKFKECINEIFEILYEVQSNMELYYKIKKDIINNYDIRRKNYELLFNLKEINNDNVIINDINEIINQKNIIYKFNKILNIYNNLKTKPNEKKITLDKEINSFKETITNLNEELDTLYQENDELKNQYKNLEFENILLKNEKKNNEDDEDDEDNDDEKKGKMKKKLSLIEKVINIGNDPQTKVCTNYNLGNKFLVIELIQTNCIKSEKVAQVMLDVDRYNFSRINPYVNTAQYLGYNITISAPHMHAYALEYLSDYCINGAHILDVGSGSGYLTVALSKMINDSGLVVGIEHINDLIIFGTNNVKKNHSYLLENGKIIFVNGDGRKGYIKYAPYNAIHVGAAVEKIPKALIDQLALNGRMFIPVGPKNGDQRIYLVDKDSDGKVTYKSILSVCYGMLTDVESQLNPKD